MPAGVHSPIDASEAQSFPGLPLFDESIDNRHQEKSLLVAAYSEAEPTLFAENRVKPGRYRGGGPHITLLEGQFLRERHEDCDRPTNDPIRKTSIPSTCRMRSIETCSVSKREKDRSKKEQEERGLKSKQLVRSGSRPF
jgi:hypothetical protein